MLMFLFFNCTVLYILCYQSGQYTQVGCQTIPDGMTTFYDDLLFIHGLWRKYYQRFWMISFL